MALAISVPNLAGIHQPDLKLYQTADHPALPPVLGGCTWRLSLASDSRGFWLSHVANPPNTLAKALAWVGGDVRGEVWFGSFILPFLLFCFVL